MTEHDDTVEVEYVAENPFLDESDPNFQAFAHIFKKFSSEENGNKRDRRDEEKERDKDKNKQEEEQAAPAPLSKKKKKQLKRLDISELKQLVKRPDVVEIHDVTAQDPRLLVYLKSYRNSVPVPKHWCQKRKYLQGKRGIEKPPFRLPDFIADTGIAKIRAAYAEKDEQKKAKQKQRERVQPKMGKIDIDYQVLHDAFFKYQTKPKLTMHGDLYYESKEFEVKLKDKKPGQLSEALKKALGMPDGAPPPWLINMQRHGPPPAYPNLKIPGLNAPIPEGASYGYHSGGWGKPPVDDQGRPLYGDVFGTGSQLMMEDLEPVDKNRWGEIENVEAEEEEEESSDEEEAKADENEETDEVEKVEKPVVEFDTTGTQSIPAGIETPDVIDIRKKKEGDKPLFQVLDKVDTSVGGALMGSSQKYVLPGGQKLKDTVEVSLNPSELENLDEDAIKEKFEKEMQAEKDKMPSVSSDVSEVYEEESRKRKRKENKSKESKSKKYKEFKF